MLRHDRDVLSLMGGLLLVLLAVGGVGLAATLRSANSFARRSPPP